MKKLALAFALGMLFSQPAWSAAGITQITVKDAGGVTRTFNVVSSDGSVDTGNLMFNNVICDPTTVTQCLAVDSSGRAAVLLPAETTKVIGTVRNLGNIGAIFDGVRGSALPANAVVAGFSDGTNVVTPKVGPVVDVAAASMAGYIAVMGTAQYNSAPLTVTNTQYQTLQSDVNGYLKVNVAAGGASGGTSSTYGATFPATGTAIGLTDGTNMVGAKGGAAANVASAANYLNALPVGQYNSSVSSITDGRYNHFQLDIKGNLKSSIYNSSGTELFTAGNPGYIAGNSSPTTASTATGSGILANATTAVPSYSNGNLSWVTQTLAGALRSDLTSWAGTALGTPTNFGTTPTGVVAGSVNASLFLGTAAPSATNPISVRPTDGTTSQVGDPCQFAAKVYVPITQTTSTRLVVGTSSKKTYVCHIFVYANAAESVAVIAGTGSVCGTSGAAMIGGPTNLTAIAANGGYSIGNGGYAVAQSETNADDVCLTQAGAVQLTGVLTYVAY